LDKAKSTVVFRAQNWRRVFGSPAKNPTVSSKGSFNLPLKRYSIRKAHVVILIVHPMQSLFEYYRFRNNGQDKKYNNCRQPHICIHLTEELMKEYRPNMSSENWLVLYEHHGTLHMGLNILITAKSVLRNGKVIPVSSIKKIGIEKSCAFVGFGAYEVVIECNHLFFFTAKWSVLMVDSIGDGMQFAENDQKQIDKIMRALDVARLS
jgi:hypothetical protein